MKKPAHWISVAFVDIQGLVIEQEFFAKALVFFSNHGIRDHDKKTQAYLERYN